MTQTTNLTQNRRTGQDRRTFSLRTLGTCIVSPRRARGRRSQDRRDNHADVFDGGMLSLALLLVGFSVLDAAFTLTLLQNGGTELNPVMRYFLSFEGVVPFMLAKLTLTAIPAVLLVAMQNVQVWGRWRVRSILAALVGAYAGLIVYELVLLSMI